MKRNRLLIQALLLLGLASSTATVRAADVRTVSIMVNGTPMVFPLDKNPVITYTDNTLHITTDEQTTPVDVPVTQITAFDYQGAPRIADANGDNSINAADIVEIVNFIMGNPSKLFENMAADVNHDGVVNAADIVELVNLIMKQK